MKLSVSEELRGNRLSLIRAVILSSSGVPGNISIRADMKHNLHESEPGWNNESHQSSWFWTFLWVKPWCSSLEQRVGPDPDAQTETGQEEAET